MAESTDSGRLAAHRAIAPIAQPPPLDAAERAVMGLLDAGYGQQSIAQLLDINLALVIGGLVEKGVMRPDTSRAGGGPPEKFRHGYVFSDGAGMFFDAWLSQPEDAQVYDIGEPCIPAGDMPLRYEIGEPSEIKIEHRPSRGERAPKFTEIGRKSKCQQ